MHKFFFHAAVLVLAMLASDRCLAQEWVAKMFSELEHNFGTVARGAEAVHRFAIKNIYKQEIELVSVRSSCGCTTPSLERKVLKTGDIAYLTASFNTRTFTGFHGATLTVEVAWNDRGTRRRGEAQVRVHGNIRMDVVFKPGAVRFESVDQGRISEQVVEVSYDGRSDWRIVDVRGASEDLEVELTQRRRSAGRVVYDLLVRVKPTAPAGYFNDQLVIVTNDGQNPRIPMHVSGRVVPAISVQETVLLGEIPEGGRVSKKVLVRGKKPFRIVAIQCDDEASFRFQTSDDAATRHIVEIVFEPKREPGRVKQPIHIATDLGADFHATFTAYATVVPRPAEPAAAEAEAPIAGNGSAASPVAEPVAKQ